MFQLAAKVDPAFVRDTESAIDSILEEELEEEEEQEAKLQENAQRVKEEDLYMNPASLVTDYGPSAKNLVCFLTLIYWRSTCTAAKPDTLTAQHRRRGRG